LAEGQTDTMLAYLTSVFLTGQPIFGVTSSPEFIDQAKAYQAILSAQSVYGGWTGELMDFFLNCLKYFGVMEVAWCKETTYVPEVTVRPGGKVDETSTVIWAGNRVRNISPYNFFWDHRVPLVKIPQDAEYAGYTSIYSRVGLKKYVEDRNLKMNINKVFDPNFLGQPPVKLFYVPDFLWDSMDNYSTQIQTAGGGGNRFIDDFSTFEIGPEGKRKTFKNAYYMVTRYMRIIPQDYDMKVPMRNRVQIWKIVTINDQVMIECERQNNNHNFIPLITGQPVLDGLLYANRSFVQKQIPLQDIASSLLNAAFDSQRRALSDRLLYDPSRVTEKNISSTSPSARIPVRPTAFNSKLSDAVYKIPYEDHQTATFLQVAQGVYGFADMISGQNPAQQGQFVKGNKTQSEWEDVQGKSSGRQRKLALKLEEQAIQPLKFILKCNILQYQPSGDMYNYEEQKVYKVDMMEMRKAIFVYTITDGILPENKVVNSEVLQVGLQTIAASPLLQSKYDLGAAFSYMMKTQNCDLKPFELAPAQAGQQLTDMANAGLTPGVARDKIGAPQPGASQPGAPVAG